jgi:type II secretory pathway component GspD/PulD (secretin)
MNFSNKFSLKVFLGFCLLVLVAPRCSFLLAAEVDVIKVQYRRAAELVPIVQTLLSNEGTVTVSERTNSLVVVGTPEAIQRVHAYLERFDQPVEQVRIRVRFDTTGADEERAVAIRGRYSSDDLSVATGGKRRDGVDISVADRERRQKSYSESFVVAMSGSPAFIITGKEIPYRSRSPFFNRYAPGGGTTTWQNVESGFEVTPTIVGDTVHLKIVPRLAYDDRKDGVIRFFAAQTELTAPLGQWVEIGGADEHQNEIIKEILSQRTGGEDTATSMYLMVEKP